MNEGEGLTDGHCHDAPTTCRSFSPAIEVLTPIGRKISPHRMERSRQLTDEHIGIMLIIEQLNAIVMEYLEASQTSPYESRKEEISELGPTAEVESVFQQYRTIHGQEGCAYDAVMAGLTTKEPCGELAVRYLLKYDAPPGEGMHPAVKLAEALGWPAERLDQLKDESGDYLTRYLAEGNQREKEYKDAKRANWQRLISEAAGLGYAVNLESARRAEEEGRFELAHALYRSLDLDSIRELGMIGMPELYPYLLSFYLRKRGDARAELLELIKKELAADVEFHIPTQSYGLLHHGNHTAVIAGVRSAAVGALDLVLELKGTAWNLGMNSLLMDPRIIENIDSSGLAVSQIVKPSHLEHPVDRGYTGEEIIAVLSVFNKHYLLNKERQSWAERLSFGEITARGAHPGGA